MTIQYVHYLMITLTDELAPTSKSLRADWAEGWNNDVIMKSIRIYVSNKGSEEESQLDYDTLLYARATRLGQIH